MTADPWREIGTNGLGSLTEGQRIRWTVETEGTAHHCGGVVFIRDQDGHDHRLYPGDGLVETYTPPLPSSEGAVILARTRALGCSEPDLVLLTAFSDPRSPGDDIVWSVAGAGDWVEPEQILPGWVQIDPATLRPTTD